MKLRKLALVPIAAAVMAIGTPAQATSVGDTVNGVVYTLTNLTNNNTFAQQNFQLTANTVGYTMSGLLDNVNIKVSDKVDVALSSLTLSPAGWGNSLIPSGSLDSGGCNSTGSGFLCSNAATPVAAPGGTYTFQFSVNKGSGDWIVPGATDSWHIGARYIDGQGSFQSLASISAVPEPEIYAMLLAGLGLMGFVARRRRQSLESGAA